MRRLLLLAALFALANAAVRLEARAAPPQPARLQPEVPVTISLPAGESIRLPLSSADPGETGHATQPQIELFFESSSANSEVDALSSRGALLQSADGEAPGWRAITFRCSSPGPCSLQIRNTASQNSGSPLTVRILYAGGKASDLADSLFTRAGALAKDGDATTLRAAIRFYGEAGARWARAGNRAGAFAAHCEQARLLLGLSRYPEALSRLNQATADPPSSSAFFPAYVASLRSQVYLDEWDSDDALRFGMQAQAMANDVPDLWLQAEIAEELAEGEYFAGSGLASSSLVRAATLSEESGSVATLGRTLRCESWVESDKGHLARSMELLRQAEQAFRAARLDRESSDALANLATIQSMRGDSFTALQSHSRLLPLLRRGGSQVDTAFLLLAIARDYMELNRGEDAIAWYRESVAEFRKIGVLAGQSIALGQLCHAESRERHLVRALADCSESRRLVRTLQDPKRDAVSELRLGHVLAALGRHREAIAYFKRARALSVKAADAHSQAEALMEWGDELRDSGDAAGAYERFRQSLPLAESAEDFPQQIEALYRIARSDLDGNRDGEAEDELRQALELAERQRRSVSDPNLQASYFSTLHKCHTLYVALLMRRFAESHDPSADAAALEISESGRALTLLDTLAARRAGAGTFAGGHASESLLRMRSAVDRAYAQRLHLVLEGAPASELESNEATLTRAMDTLDRAEEDAPGTPARPDAGKPLSVDAILQASRKLPQTFVEYSLGEKHSYVWVIRRGHLESHVLPSREVIEPAVHRWNELLRSSEAGPGSRSESNGAALSRTGGELSCMLLGPVLHAAPYSRGEIDRLVLIPDGGLNLLPFAALPEPLLEPGPDQVSRADCRPGRQPLLLRHQVVTAPSMSVLLQPRAPVPAAPADIAIVADPVFDAGDARVHRRAPAAASGPGGATLVLPRLFGSRDEALALAALAGPHRSALFLGFDASVETLLNPSLSRYSVLHIATHGMFDPAAPDLAGIVLSLVNRRGDAVPGYLKIEDIESLHLGEDLVVLSSCDSGAAVAPGAEGMAGLSHAFISSGAARVLSALWAVDDDSSRGLMVAFYRSMLRDNLEPGEALRRAQISLLEKPATASPWYWAAFTLTTATLADSRVH